MVQLLEVGYLGETSDAISELVRGVPGLNISLSRASVAHHFLHFVTKSSGDFYADVAAGRYHCLV